MANIELYVPYWKFDKTMASLDTKTLDESRYHAKLILDSIIKDDYRKNPLIIESQVKMWKGCENAIALYGLMACREFMRRGKKDHNFRFHFQDFLLKLKPNDPQYFGPDFTFDKLNNDDDPALTEFFPWFFGNKTFHLVQKSLLIRKSFEHYMPQWPGVPNNIPLWYPSFEGE